MEVRKVPFKLSLTQPLTAIQKLFQREEKQEEKKWYSGERPTNSEMVGRIYTIAQQDEAKGRDLMQRYQELTTRKDSHYYNPYAQSTNKATQELANLGFDMSGGITDKWLEENSWLKNYYRTENGNSPLAPTKTSTREQNAAYWYYQGLKAEGTTQKAENEWAALQEELTYWAKRKDRNYSDDEILGKINWNNYKTLTGMDADREMGTPTTLNRSVGYSQDALKGVIWAARNNGGTGNPLFDSAQAALGAGNQWREDPKIAAKLNPESAEYNPYAVGSTLDDAALYFGVDNFSRDWLEKNRAYLNSSDPTAVQMYQKVYNAEQTTLKAEQEKAELDRRIDEMLKLSYDPEVVLDGLMDSWGEGNGALSTLKRMDESRQSGKLMDMTRPVDYRAEDIEAYVRRRCDTARVKDFWTKTSATFEHVEQPQTAEAIREARDKLLDKMGGVMRLYGTDEEKLNYTTAHSGSFEQDMSALQQYTESQNVDYANAYQDALKTADDYAKENYLNAYDVTSAYDKAVQEKEAAEKALEELGVTYDLPEGRNSSFSRVDMGRGTYAASAGGMENPGSRFGPKDIPEGTPDDAKVGFGKKPTVSLTSRDDLDERMYDLLSREDQNRVRETMEMLGLDETQDGSQSAALTYLLRDELERNKAAMEGVDEATRKALQERNDEISKVLDESANAFDPSQYDEETLKKIYEYQAIIEDSNITINSLQGQYGEAKRTLDTMRGNYLAADRLADMTGVDTSTDMSTMNALEYASQFREYKPTDYRDTSDYDAMMAQIEEQPAAQPGKHFQQQTSAFDQVKWQAQADISNAQARIKRIKETKRQLGVYDQNEDPMGALKGNEALDEDTIHNMDREIEAQERKIKDAQYFLLQGNEDFESVVAAEKEKYIGTSYSLLGGKKGYERLDDAIFSPEGDADTNGQATTYSYLMSQGERDTYIYLRATQGEDAAKEYYDHLTNDQYGVINVRRFEQEQKGVEKLFELSPAAAGIAGSLMTVFASPAQLVGMAYSAIAGEDTNPYSKWWGANNFISNVRGKTTEQIQALAGENKGLSDVLTAFYQAGMSWGDSTLNALLFGGLVPGGGEATSALGKFFSSAAEGFIGAMPMGLSAAGSAVQAAAFKGADPDQMFAMAATTFFAETITEAITFENVSQALKGGKEFSEDFFKTLIKDQVGEGLGEFVNEAAESAFDYWIMGDKSEYATLTDYYQSKGMSLEDAQNQALLDTANDCLYAGMLGMLSGTFSSMTGFVSNRIQEHRTQKISQHADAAAQTLLQSNPFQLYGRQAVTPQDVNTQEATAETPVETPVEAQAEAPEQQPLTPEQRALQASMNENQFVQDTNVPFTLTPEQQTHGTAAIQRPVLTPEQKQAANRQRAANQAMILDMAMGADTTSQTAAIGAVLTPENADVDGIGMASAAAQHLAAKLGGSKAAQVVRDVVQVASMNMSSPEAVTVGLTVAALNEGGQAAQTVQDMAENGVTMNGIDAMITAAAEEAQQPGVAEQMQRTTTDNQIASRVAQFISNGVMNRVQSFQDAVRQAAQKVQNATNNLDMARRQEESAGENVRLAWDNFQQNPTDQALESQVRQAAKEAEGAAKVTAEYEQSLANAEGAKTQADKALDTATDAALTEARTQAQAQLAQEKAAAQEARQAAAEAQAALDAQAAAMYNNSEVSGNAVQPGSVDQGQGADAGQLPATPGRDDGRGNNAYAGQIQGQNSVQPQSAADTNGQNIRRMAQGHLTEAGRKNLENRGVTDFELDDSHDQERFSSSLALAKQNNAYGVFVDNQSVEDLQAKGAKTYLSIDGSAGAAVGTVGIYNGDIFGVFKDPASPIKRASVSAIIQAIRDGGNKLDCYDGFLRENYGNLGFIPVARVAFNDAFVENWNYERDGRPDVIFWMHNGDSADTVAEKYGFDEEEGGYHKYTDEEIAALPLFDDVLNEKGEPVEFGYDRAWAYRDQQLEYQNNPFAKEYDAWDQKSADTQFKIGTPSDVLLAVGVPDMDITISGKKILRIKKKHQGMTDAVIRQIPSIINDPILVMKSRTVQDRITMFGELMDENGAPVLAVLTTTPTKNENADVDFLVLNSAYGKDTKLQNFIDNSDIIYTDTKRADDWAAGLRLYLPSASTQNGSSGNSIAQTGNDVNTLGENSNNGNSAGVTGSNVNSRDGIKAFRGSGNRQQSTGNNQTRPRVSPYETAKTLADRLGIGHSIGTRKMNNLPRAVLGFYRQRAQYVAIRSRQAGDYQVTMHEIFHHLGERLGMTGTQEMVNHADPDLMDAYTAAERPDEAFAEFGWNWMMGDAQARQFAGDDFVDDFERAARENGIYDDLMRSREDIQNWLNASLTDRLRAVVHDKSETTRQRRGWRTLFSGLVDDSSAAEPINHRLREQNDGTVDFNMDVRANALMKNFSARVASALLSNDLRDSNGNRIGDSLAQRFEAAGITANDMDTLVEYMLLKHSLDRDAQGKPVFDRASFPTQARQTRINEIETSMPNIVEAEKAFQQFRTEFLQAWMVDTGFLGENGQDVFNTLQTMYPHYVPTQRVMDQGSAGRRNGNNRTYRIRTATGGTQDIINPIDSFVDMVNSIVTMVKSNKVAQAFDNAYQQGGMGVFGRDVTQDVRQVSVDTTPLQQRVSDLLNGNVDDDIFSQVIDAIGTEQSEWQRTGQVNIPNVITVQRGDGTQAYYEIYDPELYKLIASQRDTDVGPLLRAISRLTRGMSALTTGSNPVFAIRNFMRDFQNSVNYGSWASNYATGAAKWLRAAYDVWRNRGEYQDYVALGGGGWNRIDTGTRQGADDYRSSLFRGYNTRNARSTAKWVGQKAWNAITLARLNEIVEQTSRYAEYKYGKTDKSTAAGRQQAFLASQDVTVDFARAGNGKLAAQLKAVIPFFSASMQGVYRTGRMLTEAERGRAPARFTKTVVNTALLSAIASALMLKNADDDEKEAFANMSDDLKSQHIYLPNFAPDILGNQPLIRIPLAQDPLTYAVHGAVTNAMWHGSTDDMMVELSAIANTIVDNLVPINSTVFDPLIAMDTNKNWYGSRIVPSRMEDWETSTQYTDETPDVFVNMGRALGVSPLKLQYLAEQYTGFLGQMMIPALSKDKHTGELGGFKAALNAARKRLTSDPLVSNDIVGSFYDGAAILDEVVKAAKNGMPANMLRRGLSDEEATAAYTEAKEMTGSNGIIGKTKNAISGYYSEIDTINANETLTDAQKYALTSEVRRQMIQEALLAQEAIGAYKENYITGRNIVTDALYAGNTIYIPNAWDTLGKTFLDDADQDYMLKAKAVFDATGSDSALPHPSYTFSSNKVEYEVAEEDKAVFDEQYKTAYMTYVAQNSRDWDNTSEKEQLEILKKAHEKGRDAAKAWYKRIHGIK